MKALNEVGLKKALSFVFYQIVSKLLHWVIIPTFRIGVMKILGAKIGSNSVILDVDFTNLHHYGFRKLRIGNNCFIGDGAMLDCRGGIKLDDDVTISNRVNIVTHINVGYKDHPVQKYYPTKENEVIIKKGSYIGTAATILPGITIGQSCVVAAGAVVTKNLEDNKLYAGIPAKYIKKLI
jgi:acetyltransferase-like isoleucine patch superfamily enzyme